MAGQTRQKPANFKSMPWDPAAEGDRFGLKAGAVLAVLIFAASRPGLFAEGWVTEEELGNLGRHLTRPKADKALNETLKREIRAAVKELTSGLPKGTLERRVVKNLERAPDPRAAATRLVGTASPVLLAWFRRFGIARLTAETRRTFEQDYYAAVGTAGNALDALDEGSVRALMHRADLDAAATSAKAALSRPSNHATRGVLTLALAQVELRRGTTDGARRAIDLIQPFAPSAQSPTTAAEQLVQGRMLVTLAMALLRLQCDLPTCDTSFAREHLTRAKHLFPPGSAVDVGDLHFAHAVAERLDAINHRFAWSDSADSHRHHMNSDLALAAALDAWRLGQRWDRIRDGIAFMLDSPGGLRLRSVGMDGRSWLFPWFAALLRFLEDTDPVSPHHLPSLCWSILVEFVYLAEETPPADLPMPAAECHRLVVRCIQVLRDAEARNPGSKFVSRPFLDICQAAWFQAIEQQEHGRTS